ncbi:DUF4097 family beta strand repeat-containing protein [Robertmurraya sp. DFI.2.37]|uniref:LiaG family protein n=1 Tax=Robertmurraya sp. DFI.2.37 TaxID=3031819 RepID=UPI0012469E99|nr:DUF4097 family beta strand repeat-containing protein [Robertmurraya sp. DFI.2.37]MDF1510731.1 DUF4097 family beta strand repeat-containing protein [Robertmurraya sp. DFI.2.37]
MKRIFLIFIILIGGYLLFTTVTNLNWFSKQDNTRADITKRIDTIDFDISSISLEIVPEKRDDLEADLVGKGKVIVSQKGDAIRISYEREWYAWFSFFNKSKLTVYIPEDYDKDMEINIGSGNVELAGKSEKQSFTLDELSIDIGSGNIKLNNLNLSEFSYNGSSGNATIQGLASKSSSIDLSSGNANIDDFSGELEADISSGKLDIQFAELNDSVEIDVSSGTVTLGLPDDADFTLDGKVGSGNISYNFPLSVEKESKGSIKGTHGNGKHKIAVDVSSGSVKIQ